MVIALPNDMPRGCLVGALRTPLELLLADALGYRPGAAFAEIDPEFRIWVRPTYPNHCSAVAVRLANAGEPWKRNSVVEEVFRCGIQKGRILMLVEGKLMEPMQVYEPPTDAQIAAAMRAARRLANRLMSEAAPTSSTAGTPV